MAIFPEHPLFHWSSSFSLAASQLRELLQTRDHVFRRHVQWQMAIYGGDSACRIVKHCQLGTQRYLRKHSSFFPLLLSLLFKQYFVHTRDAISRLQSYIESVVYRFRGSWRLGLSLTSLWGEAIAFCTFSHLLVFVKQSPERQFSRVNPQHSKILQKLIELQMFYSFLNGTRKQEKNEHLRTLKTFFFPLL